MTPEASIAALPHALRDRNELTHHLEGRRPAVFLDYDGMLTPFVDRPEDAVISASMRAAVRGLAQRCPVCVVSGRDRRMVQDLMGVEDLIVAGSHGFDIWSLTEGTLEHEAGGGFEKLIERVTERLRAEADPIEGSLKVTPGKMGDDITDEDAFRALSGKGIGIFVGRAEDPEVGGRDTSAVFVLDSVDEVERFLDTLAR